MSVHNWGLSACLCVAGLLSAVAAQPTTNAAGEMVTADPDLHLQGEYVTAADAEQPKGMQVVALGEGTFRLAIFTGGLPGAGWNRQPPQVIAEEEADAVRDLITALQLTKTLRESPTLGANPPAGAVVLFDGTRETFERHWKPGAKMTDDGLLAQGATSVENFRDFTAHIEFRTPYMPQSRGQGRGNSGAYFQGRYETQILDSFGLEGKNNETGGIYEIRDPDLNMCFPPLSWQTYDVDFVAARWDDAGNKIANARMTVRLNGVVVQRDVEVPRITRAAPVKETPEPGPLYLQDHGNPVHFRNIWIVPRDADKEARRPIIPAYERFHALADDPLEGGLLLAGELGCINCHRPGSSGRQSAGDGHGGLATAIVPKQAPILTEVGKRARPEWMMHFLADPQQVKPGTTMPALFSGWDEQERNEAVLALVNFLAVTGSVTNRAPDTHAAKRGEKLYHEIGCVACHAPRNGKTQVSRSTSVPLAGIEEKYSIPSLTDFLKNPHAVRPSGRMPSLNLNDNETNEIAQYLLSEATLSLVPNVRYAVYHGNWEKLPDFDELTPVKTGECAGFDLSVAGRDNHFGIRFEGFLKFDGRGSYTFALGSDDGSVLYVNGLKIIDNDGIHPHSVKEGRARPGEGVHHIRVDYFEQAGEESLTLEMTGSGFPRQDVSALLTLTPDGKPAAAEEAPLAAGDPLAFRRDAGLVARGRELFVSLGCANCHEMKVDGTLLEPTLAALPMDRVATPQNDESARQGCLDEGGSSSDKPVPDYNLSPSQQRALVAVIHRFAEAARNEQPAGRPLDQLQRTLGAFNCFACHERGGLGGPEADRNSLFLTTQQEMGDEGRLPPPLDGVGDKLREDWLKRLLANGASDRPYMRTRMPKFGNAAVPLAETFAVLDLRDEAQLAEFDEPPHRVKSTGRQLVGDQALACIKCHTFGTHKATGIQAISLTNMTQRIREDWFLRYLYEPARYRPGTRMPTGFPEGKAAVRDIYDGDPNRQISAVWTYLTDGAKAGIPDGLLAELIELKPQERPIIYRNFIEGLSPRGIAVGYPEQGHLAWDANDLCLKLIWQGRFIDASRHWSGRGQGQQPPLGDHVFVFEPSVPIATLESRETPWPKESTRPQQGETGDEKRYAFLGYSLNDRGQPTFRYRTPQGTVSDFPEPIRKGEKEGTFRRVLTFELNDGVENACFRAAVGSVIEPTGDGYLVDGSLTIRLTGGGEPFLRTSEGRMELLVPLTANGGESRIVQEILW